MHVVRPCLCKQGVHERKVELPFCGFNLLPIDRNLQRIEVHVLRTMPNLWQHSRPGTGVMGLSAEYKVWFSIYQQRMPAALLNHCRHLTKCFYNSKQQEGK